MVAEVRSLTDSVVLITGATSGIGAAAARELASKGAKVVLTARRRDRLALLAKEIGDRALSVPVDVRHPEELRQAVELTLERFGQLDSAVIAAGAGGYGGILDYEDHELEEMIETNLGGTVWAVRAVLPPMIEQGGGDLVIVASVAGFRGGGNEAVYAATKFGQVGLAGSLDRELRPYGVRVSVIAPAAVNTEFALGRGRVAGAPELEAMLKADDVALAVRTVLEQPRRLRTQHWAMWSMSEAS